MANKAISELPQALNVNNQDLFVLEQSGIAKKLTAETFITEQGIIDALAEALDGHGGISSVTLQSLSGRIRTYQITFTDETTTTFQVLDGTSISSIQKTSTAGLVDTYTVTMSDGKTSLINVTNGSSIASVQKTSTSGLVDTYTITLTNGSTQSFTVTNGERGPVGPAGDYAGIVGRDSLTEAAMDDEFLVYDTSDELEKKISLAGLETSLTGKADLNDITQTNWYDNGYWKTDVGVGNKVNTFNTSTGFLGIKIAVKQGDVFRIDIGEAGAAPRAWCFTDESNIVLSVSAAYEEINGYKQATADGYLYCAGRATLTRTVIKLSPANAVKQELLNDQDRQDNNLAYVETTSTASRAYSVNNYFINSDGVLCRITASVASGGTLTVGTNYTVVTGGLANDLYSLLS